MMRHATWSCDDPCLDGRSDVPVLPDSSPGAE